MAGRFFQFRLHPLDIKEALTEVDSKSAFARIMKVGGFPEPFLENSESFYGRWRRSHLDIILRQDLIEFTTTRRISAIETLIEMLRNRVGKTVSCANLAQDLETDPKTIKRWLGLLEDLYVIFRVGPYHNKIARSLLKEPKYYFFDTGSVLGSEGDRFENLVACALLKELHFMEDVHGKQCTLNFLRTKDGDEVDFLVSIGKKPILMVEVKYADSNAHPAFKQFSKFLPSTHQLQLVAEIKRERTLPHGLEIRDGVRWLETVQIE